VNDRHQPDGGFDRKTQHLEGWNVDASTVVNELRAEVRRDDILLLLNLKFPGEIPAEWVAAIEAETHMVLLSTWLAYAAFASSLAEFGANSRLGPRRRK
jgi:hypothetical protein